MIFTIEGGEGSGKTTLAYTAPYPIVGFQFDLGADRALLGSQYDRLFKGLNIQTVSYGEVPDKLPDILPDIYIMEFPRKIQLSPESITGIREAWIKAQGLLVQALTNDRVKTTVIDTMTLARKMAVDSYLQSLQEKGNKRVQLIQIEYGHPDQEIYNIYSMYQAAGKNLVTTHHLRDVYAPRLNKDGSIEDGPTGELEMDGAKKVPQWADISLRTWVESGEIAGKFRKCGYNLAMLTMPSLKNPTWDSVMGMVSMSIGDRIKFPIRGTINGI